MIGKLIQFSRLTSSTGSCLPTACSLSSRIIPRILTTTEISLLRSMENLSRRLSSAIGVRVKVTFYFYPHYFPGCRVGEGTLRAFVVSGPMMVLPSLLT